MKKNIKIASKDNYKSIIKMQDLLNSVDKLANISMTKDESQNHQIDLSKQVKPDKLLNKSIELTNFLEREQSSLNWAKSRVVKVNQSSLPTFRK